MRIFTTAFAEHAITAFELSALDYVLKPFGAERLHATLEVGRRNSARKPWPGAVLTVSAAAAPYNRSRHPRR